ncbi:sodium/proline symporter [Parahaliea maris]|uniref:Sodium/proline symporter n=1 Tax=Parahaliea maris TaxID=2716870 RepID=A0A5C8ZWP9_9GAMM|nr:sodium/proline symporter [Parahaliea maris]TXS91990.1 sodium/proline symporter [Parahaliea maris]
MDTTTVLVTLVLYKALLIAIGFWAQRRTHTSEDYFLGGRQLGPVVAAISYSASATSAWTLLGVSGIAYVAGISTLWIVIGVVLGCIVAWWWVAPRMMAYSRRHQIVTLTEFLAHTSEGPARRRIVLFATVIVLVSFVFYISSQFQGAGNTFSSTFGLDRSHSILIGGGIIMVYTLLGGFWAVSLTDTLQGLMMALAAVLLPLAAWFAIGGWSGFSSGLAQVYQPEQLSLSGGNLGLATLGFIVGNLAIGIGTFGQPHLLTRFMALRDERALHQARWIATAWYALVFAGMCFLGLAGHILLPATQTPENIFFDLTALLFSPVFAGILLAAVLSAIMSTADSMLLVTASSLSLDLGLNRRFPNRPLLVSRGAIVLVCLVSVWVALALPATIFERVLFAWIAIGSAFGPLVFVRLAGAVVTPTGALASMVTGFVLAVALYLLPDAPGQIFERLLPFSAALLILLLCRVPATATQHFPPTSTETS